MKISTPRPHIKIGPLLFAGLVAGCAGPRAEAPFPARPDTVVPGDLAGPFEGRVIDSGTGKPVEGAAVLASWAFESGSGMQGPAGAESTLSDTDSDGRYLIPRLADFATPTRGHLERFTLVVYKRGYVAWRSDRRFDDLTPRRDFAQTGNLARLDKLPADASHVRHLRFVGAAGPLLPRLAWEIQQAGVELEAAAHPPAETPRPSVPEGELLDASVLLSADELKAVTGYKGEFTVGKLTDLRTSATYDSLHFRAEGKPETWDAALRVFKLDTPTAERQFAVLLAELPGAVEKKEIGDRSLRAREGDIYAVAALDRARAVVLVFTCGSHQCADLDTTVAIVKRMWSRLGRLGQTTPADKKPEGKP
jgi:hypothetical protein